MRHFLIALLIPAALGLGQNAGGENAKATTVWSGVYTEAQANRGNTAYETNCASCHQSGPPASEVLIRDWSGKDLGGFFDQIKMTMPADAPSSLSDRTYVDIVAYILHTDDFPAGATELSPGLLKSIRVEPRDGGQQVPDFALVGVVGCLVQGSDKAWRLTSASEPVRTKDPESSKDDELKIAQAKALGAQKFLLMDVYPAPDAIKGYKVEAKGFLIRNPQENRLNVTSLQGLASKCESR